MGSPRRRSPLYGQAVERDTHEEKRESSAAGLFGRAAEETPRIGPDELAEQLEGPNPPIALDVRTRSQYERDLTRIPGSIWVAPDAVEDWAARWASEHPDGEPRLRPIATSCTWPDEATSARAARRLNKLGFEAAALRGGFDAWKAAYPTEPVTQEAVR